VVRPALRSLEEPPKASPRRGRLARLSLPSAHPSGPSYAGVEPRSLGRRHGSLPTRASGCTGGGDGRAGRRWTRTRREAAPAVSPSAVSVITSHVRGLHRGPRSWLLPARTAARLDALVAPSSTTKRRVAPGRRRAARVATGRCREVPISIASPRRGAGTIGVAVSQGREGGPSSSLVRIARSGSRSRRSGKPSRQAGQRLLARWRCHRGSRGPAAVAVGEDRNPASRSGLREPRKASGPRGEPSAARVTTRLVLELSATGATRAPGRRQSKTSRRAVDHTGVPWES